METENNSIDKEIMSMEILCVADAALSDGKCPSRWASIRGPSFVFGLRLLLFLLFLLFSFLVFFCLLVVVIIIIVVVTVATAEGRESRKLTRPFFDDVVPLAGYRGGACPG